MRERPEGGKANEVQTVSFSERVKFRKLELGTRGSFVVLLLPKVHKKNYIWNFSAKKQKAKAILTNNLPMNKPVQ
jgi:hypothetical protein